MRKVKPAHTILRINQTYEAESLTKKLRRMTEQKEPIKEEVEIIYTNKKNGVEPGYDIRTDRFEVARIAAEKLGKAEATKALKSEELEAPKSAETEPEKVGQQPS